MRGPLVIRGICMYAHVLLLSRATGVWPYGGFRAVVSNINHLYTFLYTMDSAWTLMFYSDPWYISPIPFPHLFHHNWNCFAIIRATGTRLAFAMFVQVRPPYTQASWNRDLRHRRLNDEDHGRQRSTDKQPRSDFRTQELPRCFNSYETNRMSDSCSHKTKVTFF